MLRSTMNVTCSSGTALLRFSIAREPRVRRSLLRSSAKASYHSPGPRSARVSPRRQRVRSYVRPRPANHILKKADLRHFQELSGLIGEFIEMLQTATVLGIKAILEHPEIARQGNGIEGPIV